ncbi:MAG: glycosyltransferase family 1 protein, partial [bacterium]|nr:glycosyltransferase family 1 protein [bacterium]
MKPSDVLFSANVYSEKRKELILKLNSLPYDVTFTGCGYPPEWEVESTLYDFKKTGEYIRNAKIVIGDNQFPEDYGFVSNRLFESLAAGGALMLHQEVPGMEELIGFKDGEHYVKWTDFEDLKEKIRFYLSHDYERRKIADNGTKECRENHSFDKRVEELFDILKNKPLKSYEISV